MDVMDPPAGEARQQYDVLRELGDCHAALDEHDQALAYYHQAVAIDNRRSGAYVGLGAVAVQQGRLDEAESCFRTAARFDPHCSEAYGGLAVVAQHRRQFGAAFEWYLRCLELNSDNLLALLGLFQASCQMGTFGKIIQYLQLYLQRHPDDTSVQFCLASLHAREGQLQEARVCLQAVLAAEPGKVEALDMLVQVERRLGFSGQAVAS